MIGPKVSHAFSASLDNEGSGAPNGAKGRELHPLPGTAPAFMTKAGHLPVLHYTDCRDFRPNPARASASWNHRMQTTMGFPPTISPVPVQPAPGSPNTCRTGMMPRPPANRSDEPPSAEPAPAPSKAVAADDVPHDEQDGPITRIKFLESKHKKLCREIGKLRGSIFAQRAASEHLIRGKSDLCK
jgi:hypothetical protein